MRRLSVGIVLVAISAVAGLFIRAAVSGDSDGDRAAGQVPGFPEAKQDGEQSFNPGDAVARGLPPGTSLVARARGKRIDVFPKPGGRGRRSVLRGLPVESRRAPIVFLVRERRGTWVNVALPVRPNHATGWVRARDVSLRTTAYRLEVSLGSHRLVAFRGNRVIARAPIATGKAVTPTPHGRGQGRYFIADLIKPPDPGGFYGPYAFGLSAYSPVLTSFADGDGQVGIHGTNQPGLIGSDVSHGCIRVDNATITRLAREVPVGTPVEIRG